MKIVCEYGHNNGKNIVKSNNMIWDEVQSTLNNSKLKLNKGEPRRVKNVISEKMNKLGWADKVRVQPSRMTINYMKNKVGVCIQLGNVARIYADLLKLQLLYQKNKIIVAIIAVPVYSVSKKLGSNHAQYERLVDELKLFNSIIEIPILVVGLGN